MFVIAVILGVATLSAAQTLPDCPGVISADSSTTICCVGDSLSIAPVDVSTCPGWPICTGPGTVTPSDGPSDVPLTCATVLDVNDPNYSSLLASVTASIEASGTVAATTLDPTASPGGSSSGSGAATVTSTGSSTSRTASGTSSTSASSSTHTNGANIMDSPQTALGGMALAYVAGLVGALL